MTTPYEAIPRPDELGGHGSRGREKKDERRSYSGNGPGGPCERVVVALEAKGCAPHRTGSRWVARCPVHEADGEKHDPSLSVTIGRDGRALVNCFGSCTVESVVAALGLSMSDLFPKSIGPTRTIIAEYDYRDEQGSLLFQKVRYDPKSFSLRRPDPGKPGEWIWSLGSTRSVLYRLPEIRDAVAKGTTIYVVEGEKDVETLRNAGVVATTAPHGADSKWTEVLAKPLSGAQVVVIADKDLAGYGYARAARDVLCAIGATVELQEAPEGKDATDAFDRGHTLADFPTIDVASRIAEFEQAAAQAKTDPGRFPPLLSVDDLAADSDAVARFIVKNLLAAAAVTLLVARAKAGKSTFVYALLAKLEQGAEFAGLKCASTTAVVLSEEPRATINEKVRRFGITRAKFWSRRELGQIHNFDEAVAFVAAEARRIGAGLLVVDTVSAWAKLPPEHEKDSGAIGRLMAPLQEAAETGLAILATHHMRKAAGDEGTAVRGSGAFHASCETLLEMRRVDSKATRSAARVIAISSRFDSVPEEVCVELRGNEYISVASVDKARGDELRRRVLATMGAGWIARDDLIDRVEGNASATGKAISELHGDGVIEREGKGRKGAPYRYHRARVPEPNREDTSLSESRDSSIPPLGGGNGESNRDKIRFHAAGTERTESNGVIAP